MNRRNVAKHRMHRRLDDVALHVHGAERRERLSSAAAQLTNESPHARLTGLLETAIYAADLRQMATFYGASRIRTLLASTA